MASPRELMDQAIVALVVPPLRRDGFKGSYPHFRRVQETHVDLLTFQFDRNGGGFLIEIARCSIEGITTHWGTAWNVHPNDRLRIKPRQGSGTDSWFRYDNCGYDSVANDVLDSLSIAREYWSRRA